MTTDPTPALRLGAATLRVEASRYRSTFFAEEVETKCGVSDARYIIQRKAELDAAAAQLDELADAMPRLLTHLIIAKGRSDNE